MKKELLELCYLDFLYNKSNYEKMYEYYKGNTDAMNDYKMITERSNLTVNTNFLKKFVKEEVSYSVGNDITYISKSGSDTIIQDIQNYLGHLSAKHDSKLFKQMLIYSIAYELYYYDRDSNFNVKVIPPTEGYVYEDDFGNISFFMHIFKKKFEDKVSIDVYTDEEIIHYDEDFNKKGTTPHIFSRVPVGISQLSEELEDDTLYKDIKGLQDAYETNLSDIANEISDFRNAYLNFIGVELDEEDIPKMKELGIIQFGNKDAKATWLIKNINDSFIQNTLSTLEDKMYQLSSHINHNERMQSNTSSLTLRSRLIALEEKCKLNEKSLADCIRSRLKFLFEYISFKKNEDIKNDYRDITIKFTPNIPQDDLMTAQIISQLGDKLSIETGLTLFSFIENPKNEIKKIMQEEKAFLGEDLLEDEEDE